MKRFVYADNAATTKISDSVFQSMIPYLTEKFGNASSLYSLARESRRAVEAAREKVAKALGAEAREIFFTSCGTESDNWALKGAAHAMAKKGKKLSWMNIRHRLLRRRCSAGSPLRCW